MYISEIDSYDNGVALTADNIDGALGDALVTSESRCVSGYKVACATRMLVPRAAFEAYCKLHPDRVRSEPFIESVDVNELTKVGRNNYAVFGEAVVRPAGGLKESEVVVQVGIQGDPHIDYSVDSPAPTEKRVSFWRTDVGEIMIGIGLLALAVFVVGIAGGSAVSLIYKLFN